MEDHEDVNLTELTAYQLRFIDEYMKCGNKRQAMLNAGYKGKGQETANDITSLPPNISHYEKPSKVSPGGL